MGPLSVGLKKQYAMKRLNDLVNDVGGAVGRSWVAGLLFSAMGIGAVHAQDDCTAFAGTVAGELGAVCLPEGGALIQASTFGDAVVPEGYATVYVLTQGDDLVIVDSSDEPQFTVTSLGLHTLHTLVFDPTTLDLSLIELGVTTGADVNALLIQGGGTICGSLDVTGYSVIVVDPDAGGLTATAAEVCLEEGMAMVSATPDGDIYVPDGYSVRYVLTRGPGLVIQQIEGEAAFMVEAPGMYTLHTLVFDPFSFDLSLIEFGVTTGFDVHEMLVQGGGDICASLDAGGAMVHVVMCDDDCSAYAGTLTAVATEVCLDEEMTMVEATANMNMVVPEGYEYLYVLTMGEDLVIQQVGADPSFSVSMAGSYTIHTLVYDPLTLDLSIVELGVTTGGAVNALLLQGGGEICASLDVAGAMVHVVMCDDDCTAYAGTLMPLKDIFCYMPTGSVIGATVVGDAVVPPGYVARWVATYGEEMIIADIGETAWFVVDGMGLYTIHTLVYNPATLDLSAIEYGVTTAADVNAMLIQGGGDICASLDLAGVPLYVDSPVPPTLTATSGMVCLDGALVIISANAADNMHLPMGYAYIHVLTEGDDMVVLDVSETPSFTVSEIGDYTIHTFLYDPESFPLDAITPGMTTAGDVYGMTVEGGGIHCAILDLIGASVHVIMCDDECTAWAGTLEGYKPVYCYSETGTNIGAIVVGDAIVPPGYVAMWVVTQGEELVIMDINETSYFIVDGEGLYTIHTLVYDPGTLDLSVIQFGETTAYDVHALLVQGGGEICASLDMSGVQMVIDTPYSGSITANDAEVCLEGTTATLNATVFDSYLPMGFSHMYLLSMNGVIMDTSMDPSFNVTAVGNYVIHTLVLEPSAFALDAIEPGTTTISGLNAILVQGGGLYCASLDISGAMFTVSLCDGVECLGNAGTVTPYEYETCLADGSVTITAEGNGDMVVPEGYTVAYVLTSGEDMTIVGLSDVLSFTVSDPGNYTFHTLVFDPATLDAAIVTLGTTTAAEVNALLIQGGGTICASLDLVGGSTYVIDCTIECAADAGSINPEMVVECLMDDMATLTATPGGDVMVPEGYSVIYVLTRGLTPVLYDVSEEPTFDVAVADIWRIHTLVYDPMTLDLTALELGVTTAMDVNAMLIQGGGDICAALDIYGAMFTVEECMDCTAYAGTLTTDSMEVCITDSVVWLNASAEGDAVVPEGYTVLYVLTDADDQTILDVAEIPAVWVGMEGAYTLHTLVYDPLTLNLGMVTLGETSALGVLAYIEANGICASLDVTGVTFYVSDCTEGLAIINAWPVPAVEQITVQLNAPANTATELIVVDAHGARVMPSRSIGAGTNQVVLNVAGLESGFYMIRLMNADGIATYRFSKVN